jgi:hypothetical protein
MNAAGDRLRRSPFSPLNDLRQKPQRLSTASKYTALNGIGYLAIGAILIAWPGAIQTVFREPPFAGHEQALMRVIGLTVVGIGWLYLFGGRSGARQFICCFRHRPIGLRPGGTSASRHCGVFPRLFLTFTIVDALLAVGAWTLLARK